MTILVIGGTGRVGSAAIATLLEQGETVRCLSRSQEKLAKLPSGVETAVADLDDPSSLPAAFKGVSAVLLSLLVHPDEGARGLAAIEAAHQAGVGKLVHVSLKHYPGSETRVFYQSKQAIERALAKSPFKTTILRPANFFQSDSNLKPYILDQGVFPSPIGHIGVSRLDSRDVGFAAARALTTDTFESQDTELYGPEVFTGDTLAEVYAAALGQPVRYMGDDISKWAELNAPRLGPWYVSALTGLYEQQQTYGMLPPPDAVRHPLLPPQMRTMQDYAQEQVAAWRAV